jgi:hypothetical protein
MPTEYRFEDLDLREEPSRADLPPLLPGMVTYTDLGGSRANCTAECCSASVCCG